MLRLPRHIVLAVAAFIAATVTLAPHRAKAQTYQIDCAILLCLSGGWPSSVPCARARSEFIRRITPWPIEPPLQIWRCPMSAAYSVNPDAPPANRIYEILLELNQNQPKQSFPLNPDGIFEAATTLNSASSYTSQGSFSPLTGSMEPQSAVIRMSDGDAAPLPDGFALQLVQERADIDISGAEFNFVRSIRVFDARYVRQHESGREGDCNRSAIIYLGTYGTQGEFSWRRSSVGALPGAHLGTERYGETCPSIYHRSVFVEWRDYEGTYGFEQVNY